MAETPSRTTVNRKSGKSAAAFRTISEVADDLNLPQHVLRFWESRFPQVQPLKRGGGRRYYRPEDVALLRHIRDLLYTEGYTIKGVQRLLRQTGGKGLDEAVAEGAAASQASAEGGEEWREGLRGVLDELKAIRGLIEEDR